MTSKEKTRQWFAIADACFRCRDPIVKMQEYSEDNEHGSVPVTALIEKHWVTPHGARSARGAIPSTFRTSTNTNASNNIRGV
jgi:hypothetical protein